MRLERPVVPWVGHHLSNEPLLTALLLNLLALGQLAVLPLVVVATTAVSTVVIAEHGISCWRRCSFAVTGRWDQTRSASSQLISSESSPPPLRRSCSANAASRSDGPSSS